jgi:hypothetical protein
VDVNDVVELGESYEKQAGKHHMYLSMGTLSGHPEAIIASVGFIVSDPRNEGPPDTHYFKTVDWEQPGRKYNFTTIQSWLGRSTMARKSLVNQTPQVQAAAALQAVADAYKKYECVAIWGSLEDLAILRNAMEQYKIVCPWETTNQRDIVGVWATMGDLGLAPDIERDVSEPPYVALGDAAFIARGVATMYRGYRKETPADRTLEKGEIHGTS